MEACGTSCFGVALTPVPCSSAKAPYRATDADVEASFPALFSSPPLRYPNTLCGRELVCPLAIRFHSGRLSSPLPVPPVVSDAVDRGTPVGGGDGDEYEEGLVFTPDAVMKEEVEDGAENTERAEAYEDGADVGALSSPDRLLGGMGVMSRVCPAWEDEFEMGGVVVVGREEGGGKFMPGLIPPAPGAVGSARLVGEDVPALGGDVAWPADTACISDIVLIRGRDWEGVGSGRLSGGDCAPACCTSHAETGGVPIPTATPGTGTIPGALGSDLFPGAAGALGLGVLAPGGSGGSSASFLIRLLGPPLNEDGGAVENDEPAGPLGLDGYGFQPGGNATLAGRTPTLLKALCCGITTGLVYDGPTVAAGSNVMLR